MFKRPRRRRGPRSGEAARAPTRFLTLAVTASRYGGGGQPRFVTRVALLALPRGCSSPRLTVGEFSRRRGGFTSPTPPRSRKSSISVIPTPPRGQHPPPNFDHKPLHLNSGSRLYRSFHLHLNSGCRPRYAVRRIRSGDHYITYTRFDLSNSTSLPETAI